MEYGILSTPGSQNIGDAVQTFPFKDLYDERGIKCEARVSSRWPGKYRGDKLTLPMNAWFQYRGPQDAIRFKQSEDIDYRYVGYHLEGDLRSFGKNVRLKSEYPIGCRDVPTRDFLRSLGYNAYFSGCISMTFPKRPDGDYKLVYVVDDDPRKALPFCDPADIRVLTSICLPDREDISWEDECEAMARERIALLRDTAKLVLTQRLHVYLPCVAMGIPVVFTAPLNPRTSLVSMFTPATVDYIKPLVKQNIINLMFDEGDCVAEELDAMAVLSHI